MRPLQSFQRETCLRFSIPRSPFPSGTFFGPRGILEACISPKSLCEDSLRKLLLVGWDAADWKVIDPLLARGEMPVLASVIAGGVRGNLATIQPPFSPMVWTSIATGVRPAKHGILGFTEPTPDGLSVRPVSNLGRRTKAFWNIAHQNGKRSIVVGWWPSHPAEPINGAMVSDLFPLKSEHPVDAPMPLGTVSPAAIASRLAEMRVHPTELTGEILNMFAPRWAEVDQKKDRSVHDLAGIVAETMSVHCAATELIATEEWDLAAIYYVGLDHFSHRFMHYHAGKPRRKNDPTAEIFAPVVENAYRYHDAMLGQLLQLAGPDCGLMLMSDHGFHSDDLLPDYVPAENAGPAVEHRNIGIFCMRAPGVKQGEQIFGASVLDVAPTALHLLGIPVGLDMDGKVLLNAFSGERLVETVESWEAIEGDAGRHKNDEAYDGAAAAESLKQLVDLGYIAPPGEDSRRIVEETMIERRYNTARAQADAGRPDLAVPILRELVAQEPEQGRFYLYLFSFLLQMGDYAEAGRVLADFDKAAADFAPRAAEELKRRIKENPLPAPEEGEEKPGDRRESFERRRLAEKAAGFADSRLLMHCQLALSQPRSPQRQQARALLDQIAAKKRLPEGVMLFLGRGFAALKDYDRALECLAQARRKDRDNWEAMGLEARIYLKAKNYEMAANRAIESLALVYAQPDLHHLLGIALLRMGDRAEAEQAFRRAIKLAPDFAAAHGALGRILVRNRERIGEGSLHMARADELKRLAKERRTSRAAEVARESAQADARKNRQGAGLPLFERSGAPADRENECIVVTGLPRSGTSMMMQMLAAAGLTPFTDDRRIPDSDNPRGYFEHEKATQLHTDSSWLPEAHGKVVKIVAHLVPYLPTGHHYRIVFMHRDLDEVTASQQVMLKRLGRKGAALETERLRRTYTAQLVQIQQWLERQKIPVLAVRYDQAVADPATTAKRLQSFLGAPFDVVGAAKAIEPALRRQRNA